MTMRLLATVDGPVGAINQIPTTQGNTLNTILADASSGGGPPSFAIFRPGVPTAAPAYQTLAEILPLIAAADGAFTLYIDSVEDEAHVEAPTVLDGRGLLTIAAARGPVGGVNQRLIIDDGAQLKNPLNISGQVEIVSATTTIPALLVNGTNQGITLTSGASMRLLAGATRPFLDVVAGIGNVVAFNIEFASSFRTDLAGTVPFVHVASGATFSNFYSRLTPFAQPQNAAVGGPEGANYIIVYDASVTLADNSGTFLGTQTTFQTDEGLVTESTIDFPTSRFVSTGGIGISSLFPIYSALAPALVNARLLACEIETVEQLASPAMTASTAQIVAAGSLHGFTGSADTFTGLGFNAPPQTTLQCDANSATQEPNLQQAITGDTFDNLTAGHVRARIVVTGNPRLQP